MNRHILVERSQMIDIVIDVGYASNTINIPDQPMLRDKRIISMTTYVLSDFPNSPISGNPLPTRIQLSNAFFIGYTGDPQNEKDTGEYIYQMPLVRLHTMQNQSNDPFERNVTFFDDLNFQWDKCQLYFPQQPNPGAKFSYVIEVMYTSRKGRIAKLLGKKLSGVGDNDGSFMDMLIMKLMSMEKKIEALLQGKK